jgi:stress-induced morphogen
MSVSVTICFAHCIGDFVGTLKDSMPSAEELRTRIEQAMPGAQVSVQDTTGGGDHFRAEVVSDRFEGLTRIQQHKLVYDVFGDEVGGAIHALSIKTETPTPAGDGR